MYTNYSQIKANTKNQRFHHILALHGNGRVGAPVDSKKEKEKKPTPLDG